MFIISKLFIAPQLPTLLTNLERIVVARAISGSVITTLTSEASIDRIMVEATNYNFHSSNVWMLSIMLFYLYGQYKYNQGQHVKLQRFVIYDKYNKIIKEILFVLFIVFTRDVQNAI